MLSHSKQELLATECIDGTYFMLHGIGVAPSRRIRKLLPAFRLPLVHVHPDSFFSRMLILPAPIVRSPWLRSHQPFLSPVIVRLLLGPLCTLSDHSLIFFR